MTFKSNLILLTLIVILTVSAIAVLTDRHNPLTGVPTESYKPGLSPELDQAVNQASEVFEEKKKLGVDFSDGPCLTNDLLPNWVVDLAHNPRLEIDDLPENQCQAFLEGRAKHFVELDLNGKVVRVY